MSGTEPTEDGQRRNGGRGARWVLLAGAAGFLGVPLVLITVITLFVTTSFGGAGGMAAVSAAQAAASATAAPGTPPGPWDGWTNGEIPEGVLCLISFAPVGSDFRMRCDAERHLEALNDAFKADHAGASLQVTSAYRTAGLQSGLNENDPSGAAPAGASNHGWALAVDLGPMGSRGDFSSPNYVWMKAHAAQFGFVHPTYMEPGGAGPFEPWHWEYWPASTSTDTSASTTGSTVS